MNASPEFAERDRLSAYLDAGERRARALGNRGPLRFTKEGKLAPEILETYQRVGMYIFANLIQPDELEELKTDLLDMWDRLPTHSGSDVDSHGRPAVGAGFEPPIIGWSKPLGDPLGGRKDFLRDRHPVKMFEPEPEKDAPAEIPFTIQGILQFSDAALRLYGHPDLLRIAAAVNGEDFVPFSEALIVKQAGLGASFAWHQDGMTHWESPDWDPYIHGYNAMIQLFGCTAANGLWYVPGSHRLGKVDLRAAIANAGSNLLPDAVPLLCEPGDVCISNRQIIHASFPNQSRDVRMTVNMGFHRRAAVVGACGMSGDGTREQSHDAEKVAKRSKIIQLAIEARRQHYPDEAPYSYRPLAGESIAWNEAGRAALKHYNLNDLVI